MADGQPAVPLPPPLRPFGVRDLLRIGAWGLSAVAALLFAVSAISSEAGMDRMAMALAGSRGAPEPSEQAAAMPVIGEVRRLSETLQLLAADREQLAQRIGMLERSLEDVTGSIARQAKVEPKQTERSLAQTVAALAATPSPSATPPALAPVAVARPAPMPVTPTPMTTPMPPPAPPRALVSLTPSFSATDMAFIPSSMAETGPDGDAWAKVTLPQMPVPEASADAGGFGVDLGVAPSPKGVQALWAAASKRHPTLLEGMHPILVTRKTTQPGRPEFRLVVGPLPTAVAAARLCAQLASYSSTCRPAAFEGQRLAVR
jgi:hypothetical protein